MRRHALFTGRYDYDAAARQAVQIGWPGRKLGPFGQKEFKQQLAEQIPSLRMELGEYDHRAVEAAARELWESHDIYSYDRRGGARVQRGHAAALRIGGAPARGSRDELLAAGFHRPLPADARRAGVLPDRVRRQRAADRAVRGAGLRGPGRGHAPGRVRRAVPGRDPAHGRTVRGPVAAARAVARLVAALFHHRRPLPADRPDQLHQAAPGGLPAAGPTPSCGARKTAPRWPRRTWRTWSGPAGCTRSGSPTGC